MPTCCAVFISANVGRLVTVVTTVIIEIAFPQNWDTFAVVAGEFRFRIARTIIWNENEQLIKNQKINVILKIEVIRPNMISKTDKINIYLEFEVSEQEKNQGLPFSRKYKLTRHFNDYFTPKIISDCKVLLIFGWIRFFGTKILSKSQCNDLPQISGSSSEPSAQSLSPSHFQAPKTHRPLLRHLNWFSGQSWSQSSSSELSPQSLIPSQSDVVKVQFLFLHWYWPVWQTRAGQDEGSSLPFLQSFLPSHFQWIGTHLLENNKNKCKFDQIGPNRTKEAQIGTKGNK